MPKITDKIGQGQAGLEKFFRALRKANNTPRFRRLTRRRAHFEGGQYDHLRYDFDHYPVTDDDSLSMLLADGPDQIPMRMRRPSMQAGYPAKIVNEFSDLLFAERLFPRVESTDKKTADWMAKLIDSADLHLVMHEARCLGGSTGSVALAVKAVERELIVEVLDTRYLFVVDWANREKHIPATVIEQYTFKDEIVNDDGQVQEVERLVRRSWTATAETYQESEPLKGDEDNIRWEIDESIEHGCSRCPVVWICNTPPGKGENDGDADYPEHLYGTFREVDYLYSTMSRSFKANMDPTTIFVGIQEGWFNGSIGSGSNQSLMLPPNSEAKFLEATFAGYDQALELIARLVNTIKNSTSCLTFDIDSQVKEAPSGKALERMLGPMFRRAGKFRRRYGAGLVQVLKLALEIDSKMLVDGQAVGLKIGDELRPGESSEITLAWPTFITPNPEEQKTIIETALTAKGTVASTKTAVAQAANAFGVEDVDAEVKAIEAEQKERERRMEPELDEADEDED